MKGFEKLKEHLELFNTNRREASLPPVSEREKYAEAIAACFIPCAREILAGRFIVTNKVGGEPDVREIRPTAIELYYHEEDENGFKDPIMYHTNYRKRPELSKYSERRHIDRVPYFPFGSFNPHTSGLDVTFENPEEKYRASFLIREYEVSFNGGEPIKIPNSTDIYDDMLINGITLGDTDWIEWKDGEVNKAEPVVRDWRRNVPDFEKDKSGIWTKKKVQNGKEESFTIGENTYVKCPFKWQFRKKKVSDKD